MEKISGNFLTQPNKDFPLDCETLDYLQQLAAIANLAANLGGDRIVLTGCEANSDGTHRAEGFVFLRTKDAPAGEILRWEGGNATGGMYLKQEYIKITANNTDYPKAYTRRTLAPGIGEENYLWEDFTDVRTIKQLMAENTELRNEIKTLQSPPLGIIQMWAGSTLPEGYLLCNGQEVSADDYPELHEALGNAFNNAKSSSGTTYSTQSGYFRVPDLRGRFVVGQHDSDNDYKTKGEAGGLKSVSLTVEQLPAHNHKISFQDIEKWGDDADTRAVPQAGGTSSTVTTTENTGGGQTHENRPPYYVLAYIIRAK